MDIKGKKVLVTGADGFIGSHLTEMLLKSGADVKALSCYNSFNNWGWLESSEALPHIEVVTGDIRDPHFVKTITKDVDIIYHLAALIAIPFSYIAPQSYVETNVSGTLNICQAALENKCERVVHTSTSEVYGTAIYVPIDEKHPLQPQSPYSASKIGGDCIAQSFYNSFELPLITARPFNTYGPRQSARAIIPSLAVQMLSGSKELRLGNLTPTRDFNYAKDTAKGFIMLSECDKAIGETVNIGSNTEYSIKDLVNLLKKITGSDAEIIQEKQRLRPEKSEVERLVCDNRKIRELCGYKPSYSFREGLEETVEWLKNNLDKYKPGIYNV